MARKTKKDNYEEDKSQYVRVRLSDDENIFRKEINILKQRFIHHLHFLNDFKLHQIIRPFLNIIPIIRFNIFFPKLEKVKIFYNGMIQ